jgi:hypothetical protein
LIISFGTRNLLECCSNLAAAEQRLGSAHAQALVSLIADAAAFDNADDLTKFLAPAAQVDEHDSLFLEIGSDYRARFVAVGAKLVRDAGGRVDWTSVQRLKLMDILRCL